MNNGCLVHKVSFSLINLIWLLSSAHSHFLFEIKLGLLIVFLPILDLLVSLIDQVIASSNMVVSVIFDAFLSILFVKIELIEDSAEKLVFERHFLLSGELTNISISIFHLQRPSVISDIINTKSLLWIDIKYSPN
jgi:hypothetical protein